MRRRLWILAVASLMMFSTACEEIDKVLPQKVTEQTEDQAAPEVVKDEKVAGDTEEGTKTGAINETEEQAAPEIKKYVIRQGEQHAVMSFRETAVNTLQFKVLFDSSAIYQTLDPENQGDINKLYGVSDCGSYHHTNSARFGWRWYEGQLQIWAYTYMNGQRKPSFVDTVALNKFYTYEIQFSDDKYTFLLNDKKVELPRSCSGTATGYKLFPYFGGDEKAPHEISIWIEELNK